MNQKTEIFFYGSEVLKDPNLFGIKGFIVVVEVLGEKILKLFISCTSHLP
jgi:hypothetical protein